MVTAAVVTAVAYVGAAGVSAVVYAEAAVVAVIGEVVRVAVEVALMQEKPRLGVAYAWRWRRGAASSTAPHQARRRRHQKPSRGHPTSRGVEPGRPKAAQSSTLFVGLVPALLLTGAG